MVDERNEIPRRTVARGVAWSAPALALGAAAPAVAASAPVTFAHRTRWSWYSNNAPWCTGQDGIEISSVDTGVGVSFTGTTTNTKITDVAVTLYFTRNNFTFSRSSGDTACWSIPVQQGAGVQITGADGVSRTYYPYQSTYTCAITATSGTTTLKGYKFRTQCLSVADAEWTAAKWTRRVATATVDGEVKATDTGAFQIAGA